MELLITELIRKEPLPRKAGVFLCLVAKGSEGIGGERFGSEGVRREGVRSEGMRREGFSSEPLGNYTT